MGNIVESVVERGNPGVTVLFSTAQGTDTFPLHHSDARTTLLINNSGDKDATITVKAGDGTTSAEGNFTFVVKAKTFYALPVTSIDSSRVKEIANNVGNLIETVPDGGVISSVGIAVIAVE